MKHYYVILSIRAVLNPYYFLAVFLLPAAAVAYAEPFQLFGNSVAGEADGNDIEVVFDADGGISEAILVISGHNGNGPVDISDSRVTTYADGGFTMTKSGLTAYSINGLYTGDGEYTISAFISTFDPTQKYVRSDRRIIHETFGAVLVQTPDKPAVQQNKSESPQQEPVEEKRPIKIIGYAPHTAYTTTSMKSYIQVFDSEINAVNDIDSTVGRISDVNITGSILNPDGTTVRSFSGTTQYAGHYENSWIVPENAPTRGIWSISFEASKQFDANQTSYASWVREFYVAESDNPSIVQPELLLANATTNKTILLSFNKDLKESTIQLADFAVTNSSNLTVNVPLNSASFISHDMVNLTLNDMHDGTPNALRKDITYTVLIKGEIKDLINNIVRIDSSARVNTDSIP